MFSTVTAWLRDYAYATKFYAQTLTNQNPPQHYLDYIDNTKVPVLLIPGVNTKWHFLKRIADDISQVGHPVHIIKDLGHNRQAISPSADIVRAYIDEHDLHSVIILAHSKGGLIGKQLLLQHNHDKRIVKVIAIASPFAGSSLAKVMPDRAMRELSSASTIVQDQHANTDVNQDIISIYGMYDNHVWPVASAILAGAENIQVNTNGHHQILSSDQTKDIVLQKVAEITEAVT